MTDCARRAAGWLVRAQGPDGAIQDRFDRKDHHSGSAAFNEVRHAAATMMLWKATQLAGGESLLPASEAAVAYIRRSATPIGSQELGYVHRGKLKLGGQSLAIVALIERKAITGDTEDDEQIGQLAAFLSRLEKPEQPGSFYQSVERGQMGSTESSEVYEGQALYALVRLQALLPESNRAELLERALHFHLFVRDGEITARSRPPREDLWLTLALTESPDLASSPAARALIALQASSMMSGIQKLGRHAGAADARRVPAANRSAAGMARRIEALGAVEAWARREGDTGLANRCHQSVIQALPSILVKDGKRNPGDDSELQALWESASDEHQIRLDTVTHVLGAMLTVLREERIDPRVEDSPPDADAASESPRRGRHRTITRAVYDAAIRRSIPVRTMSYARERVDLGTGIYQQRFWGLSVSTDSHHGARIAQDKYVAKRLLAAAGLPTPEGYPARTLEQALDRAATMGYPVVLKPRSGNKGQDVYLDLQNDDELTRAWNLLARADPPGGPLIERFLPGEEYRVLVIGGSVAAANHRIPPSVVGDGRATILQLIEKENARPERFTVGLSGLCRIVIDDHMRDVLARDGKSLDAILPQGQRQLVRRTTNVSTGATTAEVTDCMHPDNLMICQTAARVCGLEIAGVDFVARDISQSVLDTGGGIIEINSSPGLIDHIMPVRGEPRDVGGAIVDMLFPPGTPVRVPIVIVVGSSDSSAIAIRDHFESVGTATGLLTQREFAVRGARIGRPDPEGPLDAGMLLNNPFMEIAIVHFDPERTECKAGSVLYSDVVVLNGMAAASDQSSAVVHALPTPVRGWVVIGPFENLDETERVRAISPNAADVDQQIVGAVVELLTGQGFE